MRDSFRVYASNDGVNWSELVTNNSTSSRGSTNAELPSYLSDAGGVYRGDKTNQRVQEAFDPTGGPAQVITPPMLSTFPPTSAIAWRQARVDLAILPGSQASA